MYDYLYYYWTIIISFSISRRNSTVIIRRITNDRCDMISSCRCSRNRGIGSISGGIISGTSRVSVRRRPTTVILLLLFSFL